MKIFIKFILFISMNTYEYQKLRGLKRKLYLIDLRGSCCEKCGYNKNISAFEFHHKDSSQKESQLDMRKLSNSTMEWIMKEFEKCLMVCANCHREIHNDDLTLSKVRETVKEVEDSALKIKEAQGCKCQDCGVEINYTYARCKICADKAKRKIERPDLLNLKKELDENGVTWCANKYNVSRNTIHRWLGKKIKK